MNYNSNEADDDINYIHEYFRKLSVEVDSKLLTSSSKPHDPEITKTAAKVPERYELRTSELWAWLHEASKCYQIHLRNASSYHQFKKDLKDLAAEVESAKEECSRSTKNRDVFNVAANIRTCLEKLLDLQVKVMTIHEMSHRVVPIHLRRLPCQPNCPRIIFSIGSFFDNEKKLIEESSEFYLLDNADPARWKIQTRNHVEMTLPSLLFVIPPPDPSIMQEAYRLRWHLMSTWRFCVEEAKKNLHAILAMQLNDRKNPREMQQLASTRKVLETLADAKDLLFNEDKQVNGDKQDLNEKIQTWTNDLLSNQNSFYTATTKNSDSFPSKEWQGCHDLTQNVKEMDIYMKNFAGEVASQVCLTNHLVTQDDPNNKPIFKSSAYVQRWNGEKKTRDNQVTPRMLMISEVGSLTSNFTSSLSGEVERIVEEKLSEEHEETEFTSQTIKETEKFFIRGVHDPRTGQNISTYQAIADGIINLKKGVYRNLVTGENILIPEAMRKGLIMVEYSNKSVEMGELIRSGIIKTFTRKEIVSYVVLSIKDPKSGKTMSVRDALKLGIIDQEQGRYVLNKDSGDSISIQSAIDRGLLDVKELRRSPIEKEEPSNIKVIGVYDVTRKQFIPLQQALRRDVMDKHSASFKNQLTGEVIPLKEAVRRGLVLLEVSQGNDTNSLNNFPVLKSEDFDEIVGSVAQGYSTDPILEFMSEVSDDSWFYDPFTKEKMSLKKAITSSKVEFDPLVIRLDDGTRLPLQDALKENIINLSGSRELLNVTEGKRSMQKLAEDGRLDLNSGEHVDLATGEKMSLEEAAEAKKITSGLLFYWDNQLKVVTSLKASLDNGRIKDGKFFDYDNNKWLTMKEAIDRHLIDLDINTDELMKRYSSLQLFKNMNGNSDELLNRKLTDNMSVEDAILQGKLDIGRLQVLFEDGSATSLSEAARDNCVDPLVAQQIVDVVHRNDLDNFFVSNKNFNPSTGKMVHPITKRTITLLQAEKEGLVNPDVIFMVDCTDGNVKSMSQFVREGKFSLESGRLRDENGNEKSLLDGLRSGLVKSSFEPDDYLKIPVTNEAFDVTDSTNQLPAETEEEIQEHKYFDERAILVSKKLNELKEWVDNFREELQVLNHEASNPEVVLRNVISHAQYMESDLHTKSEDCMNVESEGSDVIDFFKATGKESSVNTEDLENDIGHLNDSFNEFTSKLGFLINDLIQANEKESVLQEMEQLFSNNLSNLEDVLNSLALDEAGRTKQEKLKELNRFENSAEDLKKMKEEIEKMSHQVFSEFTKFGRKPKSEVFRAGKINDLLRNIQTAKQQLNKQTMDEEINNKQYLQQLANELQDLEGAEIEKLSFDREKLLQQIEKTDEHIFAVENLQEKFNNCKLSSSQAVIRNSLNRLKDLKNKACEKREKASEMLEIINRFYEKRDLLKKWMNNFIQGLNKKDEKFSKAKVKELYEEKSDKENTMSELKKLGKEILHRTGADDNRIIRNDVDAISRNWNELTDVFHGFIKFRVSTEIEKLMKYLEDVESKMNSLEPININRDQLMELLKSHQKFHSTLMEKKQLMEEIIKDYSNLLNDDSLDDVKMKLDGVREQSNVILQSSISRLICLEDAVTLATHFDESLTDLKSWTSEVEADVGSVGAVANNNMDEINRLQDHIKRTNREINDHFELIESFKETGNELKELCDERGIDFINTQVTGITDQYAVIKDGNRKCLETFQDAVYNSNDEAYSLICTLQDDLDYYSQTFTHSFHPSISQSKLTQQIDDLKVLNKDVIKIMDIISQIKEELFSANRNVELESLEKLEAQGIDLEEKMIKKAEDLEDILELVVKFGNLYADTMSGLQTIQDNFASQDYPGVEYNVICDQANELSGMEEDLQSVQDLFAQCDEITNKLVKKCDVDVVVEIKKLLSNRDHIMKNIIEGLTNRKQDLEVAAQLSQKYGHHLERVATWLPQTEEKLAKLSTNRNGKRKEELNALNEELTVDHEDVIKLKDVISSFKFISPLSTDVLTYEVNEIESRFNNMKTSINKMLGTSINNANQLKLIDELFTKSLTGPHNAMEKLWIVEILQKEFNELRNGMQDTADNQSLSEELSHTQVRLEDSYEKCSEEIKHLKTKRLEVERLLQWFDDYRNDMIFLRALRSQIEPLKVQAIHFKKRNEELQKKMKEANQVTDEMMSMNGGIMTNHIISLLQNAVQNSAHISTETENNLKQHLEEINSFNKLLDKHGAQMNIIETSFSPHQSSSSIDQQNLETIRPKLSQEQKRMEDILKHGSVLKFFGRKQDSVTVNSILLNAQLRWKKLLWKINERKKDTLVNESQRQKFKSQHVDLQNIFKEFEDRLKSVGQNNSRNLLNDLQMLEEEMERSEKKLQDLNETLRSMKVMPGGHDNDFYPMVQELKKKWNDIHSGLINKKNKLDRDLISSGKLSEAIDIQCDWLQKCIEYLNEGQPLYGDLDTVAMLIDHHKNFQEDLNMHESVIDSIRKSPSPPPSIDQLISLWNEVIKLNGIREERLQEALKLATEFQEIVETVRRELPEIEEGLKERSINVDDEEQLLTLIQHYQSLYDRLCEEQPNIDQIKFMSDEIFENCHPSAVRFMQYYLTITDTRWEQAMLKSTGYLDKLNENLSKLRGGVTVVEDLKSWLAEAQQLLVTKNKDPPPMDLTTVDMLTKDHQDFHEDLINKNKEIEEIARDMHLNNLPQNQVQALQNKWRTVWRLSVERKKMLQETFDYLVEVETFQNFNFEEWRQKYNDWIKTNKLRVTDFFRKQDVLGYGTLRRNQFVDGMMNSKFKTNKMELNAVFDLFVDPSTGEMEYQKLIEALKFDKTGSRNTKIDNPSKYVDDEVVSQISKCQCRKQFAAYKIAEGKYQFGDKGKMYLLRFVNGAVMVRVGGGWVSLGEFLQSNDPCRVKNRTNIEIYRTLQERRKSSTSLNKSLSGSTTSLNMSQQQTPKRSRTPQSVSLSKKNKNSSLHQSTTSLVSAKSKESDPLNVYKSADSLKSSKIDQKSPFVPPRRVTTQKTELNNSKDFGKSPSGSTSRFSSQK